MKIEGVYKLAAVRERVFERLLDPESLAKAMPGCDSFEERGDGAYTARIKVGVGPIKGTYEARVEILDRVPPEHYRMTVEGKGSGGFVKGDGAVHLSPEGDGTLLKYSGEVQVGGLIASVGQRMMQTAAKQIVNQFFQAFVKLT